MTARVKAEIGIALVAVILSAVGLAAYIQEREARLTAELTAKLTQQDIDARDKQRDSQISELQAQLKAVKTPAQAVKDIPRFIELPQPIKQVTEQDVENLIAARLQKDKLPDAPSVVKAGDLVIPEADVMPLDAKLNKCKQDEIKLVACLEDSKDLVKQRDAYRAAVKGGTFFQRVKRELKWVGIGVVIGGTAYAAARR